VLLSHILVFGYYGREIAGRLHYTADNLVHHPDRSHPEQGARLTAARRWLEDSGFVNWLIMLDNVDPSTLSFLREHLPRRNRQGNILFTTRTSTVAQALAYTAGQQHETLDL
jgi:hypothetical protein